MNESRAGINSLSDQRRCWRPPCISASCPSTLTSSILHPLGLPTSSHPCLESRASFLGNRYFVFPKTGEAIVTQAMKFGGLYGVIAVFHGLVLLIWTDWYALDYRIGFLDRDSGSGIAELSR